MTKIAVIGLGAMGSRMAMNLLKGGFDVTVWNRTEQAANALIAAGATWAPSPKAAAHQADFVLSMVRDDPASRDVWLNPQTGALAGMAAGAVAIESSTLTPQWIRELGESAKAAGVCLLEAPVSGSRPQAEAGLLVFLVGGDGAVLQRARPLLNTLGSAIHHVGALGSGALVKLATNTLLGIQVTALAEIIGNLARHRVDVPTALGAIAGTSVWAPVANYLSTSMVSGNFAPQFPIDLIEKDFGYMMTTVGADKDAPTIAAARNVFRRGIEQGIGGENMTGVVKLFQ